MRRPPLANLFAVHDANPAALDEMMLDLQHSGEFARVWRPAPGWVAAVAPLPGGTPDDDLVRQHQLAFAEGRDVLLEQSGKDPVARLSEIAELADLHPDRLATLPGDFGFVRFRPGGAATVVRSCGGLVPFYLYLPSPFQGEGPGVRVAISTRLGDFVRYLPDEFRLDPLVNAVWAASWGLFPDNRTFLAGVTILPRGHYARLDGQTRVARYWDPRPARVTYPTPAQATEHAERLRSLLIAKLERDLHPDDGNLLTLSGGVDSSSLGALAAGVVGRKVWTLSMIPRKERPDLVAHEMSFIEPLAQQYGFARRWVMHFHERLVLDLWREAQPIVFHVLHPALCRLPAIMQEAPVRVLFGGEFGDEMCGSKFTIPDWARQTCLARVLLQNPRYALRHPRAALGRWAKYRLEALRGQAPMVCPGDILEAEPGADQPVDVFHPAAREEYRAWWEGGRRALNRDPRPWRHLAMNSATLDPFVPMNWEACSALGVRRSFPFFTREVFELAFACHPTELYGAGDKKLLRRALHDDVPRHNLYRADKSSRDDAARELVDRQQFPMPAGRLPEELAEILDPAWFAHPPEILTYWQFRSLTRLLIFVESLRARRAARAKGGAMTRD